MHRFVCAVAALATACGGSRRAPKPPPTVEQQILAASDAVLECLGSAGTSCLYTTAANAAWVAQQDLELVAALPPPVLARPLLVAADRAGDPREGARRANDETARAMPLAEDMSCRAVDVASVGAEFDARRTWLVDHATRMGLGATVLGPAVGTLRDAATPLGRARLVTARCNRGDLFLLIAPPDQPLAGDEDPRAHAAGGWEPFVVSTSRERLVRGVSLRPEAAAPRVADPVHNRDAVDPWIPVSEVEL